MYEELIFSPQTLHNHASCIVECPNGDLLVCWYRGSGERSADDVKVYGSRLRDGNTVWSEPFIMADTIGFPDTNPCMIIDREERLWLFWQTIISNEWMSALAKYKTSCEYMQAAPSPIWSCEKVMHLKPGNEFLKIMARDLDRQWASCLSEAQGVELERRIKEQAYRHNLATNKLNIRLGWMTRAHPFLFRDTRDKRLIVPMYSDGFDFSLMAITDDSGATWQVSEPVVGAGNVQPSIAERRDGTLVAYFRDNGPAPKRVMQCESTDRGISWTSPYDNDLPDPGAGLEVLVLKSGRWILINNDTEHGRHSLALTVSEDEGLTWPYKLHLEHDEKGPLARSCSYPSIIQAQNGEIHATYSCSYPQTDNAKYEVKGESIKHVRLSEEWLITHMVQR